MDALVFGKGLVLGFVLCAPLGPVGLLCVQRTIASGRLAGALAVLGAAVVDALFTLAAVLGLSLMTAVLVQGKPFIQPVAGGVLALVGAWVFFEPGPSTPPPAERHRHLRDAFFSTFFLMLSNPLPVLVIGGALSTLNDNLTGGRSVFVLVAGVFAGSALWAPILACGVSRLMPVLGSGRLRLIQKTCGALIAACGIALGGASFLQSLP